MKKALALILTLACLCGAALAEKPDTREVQVRLEGKEVTFGDEKKITVSLNGTVRPAYGADGKWKLTEGFNFAEAGAVVAKAADCADWVKGFGFTDDGDLYADVKATGLMILFM